MTRTGLSHKTMWTVVAVAVALSTAILFAQAPAAGHHDGAAEQGKPAGTSMGAQNMPDQKAMMERMAAGDTKLELLLGKMNAATGNEKVAAIAAVVTELAAQRRQMQDMMRMQGGMMEQMMSRMGAMHGSGGMMKGTTEPKKDATDADHAAHHPEK